MKISSLFYLSGTFFIIVAMFYLSVEDLFDLSDALKLIVLICFMVGFFILGKFLMERDL